MNIWKIVKLRELNLRNHIKDPSMLELHMRAAAFAVSKAESLNSLVEKAIKKYVNA